VLFRSGFTDCLLQAGAREVVAVDVGYGDFDWGLRNDSRVRLLERTNVRTLDLSSLGKPFDLVVADLSFISLTLVADRLVEGAAPSGDLLLLVKPQFEAPRPEVGPGGIVRDPEVWRRSLESVAAALGERGFVTAGVAPSRLLGAQGNREFFLWARRDREGAPGEPPSAAARDLIGRAVAQAETGGGS
jgi:23S rRNA (cytidine1920-2'-O)/16S rRNA (cytidine1409-2'-O)-methyltransferase